MKLKLPISVYNWTSITGVTLALIALFMILFLFIISAFLNQGSSYLGLIIYILLPGFLIVGLILIPLGMFFSSRKQKRNHVKGVNKWPLIDLNDIRHRNGFFIFIIGTAVFLLISAIGSYEAFHYTESVEFCGKICHKIMTPEYTAYQHSPHARVACVDCHVGTGASWYVKSKLSGLYQVYAATIGSYPKPIPTPVRNLRPARETCEQCHWPQKFYSRQLRLERHYIADSSNTEWDINMVVRIGANLSALGLQEGIHWHINPNTRIEYIASDISRTKIPWVKYTNIKTGKVSIFKSTEEKTEKLNISDSRIMDCMDCHNRPSHNYLPPVIFINDAITSGLIPKSLPEIKSKSLEVLGKTFSTSDSTMEYIRVTLTNYYKASYSSLYATNRELVDRAIKGVQTAVSANIFPEMKVRWDAYPNQIGHLTFNGCFRCHDDKHVSDDGKVISKDCNLCHIINAQGTAKDMQVAKVNEALEFKHPSDVGDAWKESLCTECHTGLNP
ncbi:MAG: NapC/NirT family cytochrome c [Clostridiales bacterium]